MDKDRKRQEEAPDKPAWQRTREGWYDQLNVTVKQLDIIIGLGIAGLVIVAIVIVMDAVGVF